MTEDYPGTRPFWKRATGLGQRAARLAQKDLLRNNPNVREFLGEQSDKLIVVSYYGDHGEIPILNAQYPAPVVSKLLEEVSKGNIAKEEVIRKDLIVVEPAWVREKGGIVVTDLLHHEIGQEGEHVPGEFDGWFMGRVSHGTPAPVLLSRNQVQLPDSNVDSVAAETSPPAY